MACSKTLTLNPVSEGDVPLDQAIYSSTNGAIYGVRGGWVHKFNATTGALIASAVFSSDAVGPASITELAGVIYVCSWWTNMLPEVAAFRDNRDIFSINPTTLEATNTHIWKTYKASVDDTSWLFGPGQITTDGTRIWGLLATSAVFFVVPSNPTGLKRGNVHTGGSGYPTGGGPAGTDLIWDSTNEVAVGVFQYTKTIFSFDNNIPSPYEFNYDSFSNQVVGLCYCPDTDSYYVVDNTSILVKVDAATLVTTGSVNTGEATANPRRIKYNPVDGYIYVPGWASNSVIVIDPSTDSVVDTKTGFNQPWDVVFTPTKAFAVQNAPIGLREIT